MTVPLGQMFWMLTIVYPLEVTWTEPDRQLPELPRLVAELGTRVMIRVNA